MKRIIVIGSPGAGKSVFSKAFSERTGVPLYHLDMIWHKPDKSHISREEFDRSLAEIMEQEEWIIDGNYMRTIEMRLKECDTVFLLDFPSEVCLQGAKSRVGKKRSDMPWIETELDSEFESFIKDFPDIYLPEIYSLLEKYSDQVNGIIFKSRKDVTDYFKYIQGEKQ